MTKIYKPDPKRWIKQLDKLGNEKTLHDKFKDFCAMAYYAHAKLTALPEERDSFEERYMRVVNSYRNKDIVRGFKPLFEEVTIANEMYDDFLGDVAGQIEVLSAGQGQFFTPMSVSRMMAQMLNPKHEIEADIKKQGFTELAEPACGAGGMILAHAEQVARCGYNPMITMLVHATDLNQLAFHMTFIQLSYAGVPAWVEHGNSLSLEKYEGAWTPIAYVFRSYHGHLFPPNEKSKQPDSTRQHAIDNEPPKQNQLSLF